MIWNLNMESILIKGNSFKWGSRALLYSRMRYNDPRGDFGRQMRQRQVIQAVIKKGQVYRLYQATVMY